MKIQPFIYAIATAGLIYSAGAADPPATANPAAAGEGVQVGVGKRDGVTVTGNEAFITRNGATEKLAKELILPSGVTIRPDGTMLLPDKSEATLRASQMLTFEGKVVEIPVDPNVNPAPQPTAGNNAPVGAGAGGTNGTPSQNVVDSGNKRDERTQNGGGSIDASGGFNGNTIPGTLDGTANNPATNRNLRTFIGKDGVQFTGTINQDGSINTADGRSVANDGSVRAVTFDQNGTPVYGTIDRKGTTTYSNGTVTGTDGTSRTADGRMIPPGQNPNAGAQNQNGTNPNATGAATPGNNQTNQRNSPNNAGTVNVGNQGGAANNTGTVNNPNGNPVTGQPAAGSAGQGTGGQGASGQTNGGATGRSGASGAHSGGGGAGKGSSGGGGASGGNGGGK